jgi:hypothetical protein
MPFKPNYRMQRVDRERAKEEKLKRKLERRAEKGDTPDAGETAAPTDDTQGVDSAS